jgi:hypothetical protein
MGRMGREKTPPEGLPKNIVGVCFEVITELGGGFP